VLIVMPDASAPRPVVGYLVPSEIVADCRKTSHRDWLALSRIQRDNRTWNLWSTNMALERKQLVRNGGSIV